MSNKRHFLTGLHNSKTNLSRTQFLPYFLLNQHLTVIVSKDTKYFNNTLYVDKNYWAKFFTLAKLNVPTQLTAIVDGVQYGSTLSDHIIQFNTTQFLNDTRLSVYTCVPHHDFSLPTTTCVYKSSVWLERELSDFTGLNFWGLIDTRRLLLDYFEPKMTWQTHINNDKNFNETLYDIMLSY